MYVEDIEDIMKRLLSLEKKVSKIEKSRKENMSKDKHKKVARNNAAKKLWPKKFTKPENLTGDEFCQAGKQLPVVPEVPKD